MIKPEELKAILDKYPSDMREITITKADGTVAVKAAVIGNLAVHANIENPKLFNITHVPTGMAVMTGYEELKFALLGVRLVYHTLADQADPFSETDPLKVVKKPRAKAIAKFLHAHRKVWNNLQLEKAVGVFYRDRAETERLRHKINPKLPVEYLDHLAHDERMISEMISKGA